MAQLSFNEAARSCWRSACGERWPGEWPDTAPCSPRCLLCAAVPGSQAGCGTECATPWGDGMAPFGSLHLPLAALHCCASVSLSEDCPDKLFGLMGFCLGAAGLTHPRSSFIFQSLPEDKSRASLAVLVDCLLKLAFSNEHLEPTEQEASALWNKRKTSWSWISGLALRSCVAV